MTTLTAGRPLDWSELDAIVGAELDLLLLRRSRPVAEPEVRAELNEMQFIDMAVTFLSSHADPVRLIAELERRVVPVTPEEETGKRVDLPLSDPSLGQQDASDHHDEGDVP